MTEDFQKLKISSGRDDLTVVYVTAGRMPERWLRWQREVLREAVRGAKIVVVARERVEGFGDEWVEDKGEKSHWNIYHCLLMGARVAETDYVAMAEDDVLYTRGHFWGFRPRLDEVGYDRSRWSLFVWDPIYCLRQRVSNCALVAGREYLIDAIEERERKWPGGAEDRVTGEVGRWKVERWLGVGRRNCVEWWGREPIVQLNHVDGSDDRQKKGWKKHGEVTAVEIPRWGNGRELVERRYYGRVS